MELSGAGRNGTQWEAAFHTRALLKSCPDPAASRAVSDTALHHTGIKRGH